MSICETDKRYIKEMIHRPECVSYMPFCLMEISQNPDTGADEFMDRACGVRWMMDGTHSGPEGPIYDGVDDYSESPDIQDYLRFNDNDYRFTVIMRVVITEYAVIGPAHVGPVFLKGLAGKGGVGGWGFLFNDNVPTGVMSVLFGCGNAATDCMGYCEFDPDLVFRGLCTMCVQSTGVGGALTIMSDHSVPQMLDSAGNVGKEVMVEIDPLADNHARFGGIPAVPIYGPGGFVYSLCYNIDLELGEIEKLTCLMEDYVPEY